MKDTMYAAVVTEYQKPLVLEELPIPKPKAGQIQVKIEASGVCHSDLHFINDDFHTHPTLPFISGHEGVGFVSAVGSGVTQVKEGDRVGISWLYSSCGHCSHCLSGHETLCESQLNTGRSVAGCFAEYVIADPNYVGHLPANVDSIEIAPILCAGVTVYKGLKMTDTRPGNWVAILGIGGLGHLAIQYAKAMGLNIVAVDIDDSKLTLAQQLGASITINALTTDPVALIKKELGGVHSVLVTAVSLKAYAQVLGMLRRGGTAVFIALPPGSLPISILEMVANAITIKGSLIGTRIDLQEALSFAAQGKVKPVVSTERLENINAVFDQMREGTINGRVVLDMSVPIHKKGE